MDNRDKVTDWAIYLIKTEELTRRISNFCLHKKYDEAINLIPDVISELRCASAAMAIVKNKEQGNFK